MIRNWIANVLLLHPHSIFDIRKFTEICNELINNNLPILSMLYTPCSIVKNTPQSPLPPPKKIVIGGGLVTISKVRLGEFIKNAGPPYLTLLQSRQLRQRLSQNQRNVTYSHFGYPPRDKINETFVSKHFYPFISFLSNCVINVCISI